MKLTTKSARYLMRVASALEAGTITEEHAPNWCTECGEEVSEMALSSDHIFGTTAQGEEVVIVGCEGYLTVAPKLVGSGDDYPDWDDWRQYYPDGYRV